jgi:16S rRNA (cytosine967-C5)-methyltransferase
MISPARAVCYRLLKKIESHRVFSDDALNSEAVLHLETRDGHLATEIVYGTLRWQALLDYILSSVCSRPWDEVALGAKILLRMSLYQMWRLSRIPDYALVNDAVELAKTDLGKGIDSFINGILRHLTRTHPWKKDAILQNAPDWIRASLPKWLWDRWSARYGENAAMQFALSLNSPPQPALRLTAGNQSPEALQFAVIESKLVPGAYIPDDGIAESKPELKDAAAFQIQDEASQLIPHLIKPLPGWKVWDTCAAPGGKAAILSRLCGEGGRVVASDLRKARIRRMHQFLRSAGAGNTDVLLADACQPSPFRSCFDAVLVDVPCSGLGTLRRNPEIKWSFQPQEFTALQKTQNKILHNASEAVRIGGRLLYSTCSTEPEENEHVIRSFLDAHGGFRLVPPDYPSGIELWTNSDLMVRTFPSQRLWDGFFAALMTRHS